MNNLYEIQSRVVVDRMYPGPIIRILSAEAEPSAYLNQNRLAWHTNLTDNQLHLKLDSQEASNKKGTELKAETRGGAP